MTARTLLIIAGLAVLGFAIALRVMISAAPPPAPRAAAPTAPVVATAPSPGSAVAPPAPAPAPVAPPPASPPPDASTSIQSDPRTEREQIMSALRDSPRADEPWAPQAQALFTSIGRDPAIVEPVGCFAAGCGATFTFSSEAEYHARLAQGMFMATFRDWKGGKKFTEPEVRPDGRVVIGLVLYRPD